MKKLKRETAMMTPPEDRYAHGSEYGSEYRVLRAWSGVRNGQIVILRPDRAKRLLKAGVVKQV